MIDLGNGQLYLYFCVQTKKRNKLKRAIIIVFLVLLVDQISKIWIKTNFFLGEDYQVLGWNWFRIHFVENNGMAWGTEIGGRTGKLILTLFRIGAVIGISVWLKNIIKKKQGVLLITSVSLILAGALGNILDSVFYGIIFDTPEGFEAVAIFMADEAYGSLFYGKVVDMFYFPMWRGNFPEWFPLVGGDRFTFFNAIFNVADAAISIGVGIMLVFSKKIFPKEVK